MSIYLGLGSNQGDRKKNLESAISQLKAAGFRLQKVSPVVESPAMLPREANPAWNIPFLNLVIAGQAEWSADEGLRVAKRIESSLGRAEGPRWSPRPIDIDLLLWNKEEISTEKLTIPHPGITDRDFVITPLMHLAPGLEIPGLGKTAFELSLGRKNIPLWMGILNITPDSFSDGGSWNDRETLAKQADKLIERDVHIIDIGAESTRPNADVIDEQTEWQRLEPVLRMLMERLEGRLIRPLLSLDSRHPGLIARALPMGIDIINDVTGLDDPAMLALAREVDCDIVAMHALSVPVDPKMVLPAEPSALEQINRWVRRKMEVWNAAGIDPGRMIVDPGIGFGKSSIQAYQLMSSCAALRDNGLRILIGHSRKSFMTAITARPPGERDLETLGLSLGLCQQGVDIIRVHQPFIHQRAYRAWSHLSLC